MDGLEIKEQRESSILNGAEIAGLERRTQQKVAYMT